MRSRVVFAVFAIAFALTPSIAGAADGSAADGVSAD